MCHGSPRVINEFLWESATPDGLVRRFLESHGADVILCSHTGIKWHRALPEDRHLVNVGVIGRPENDGTPRVWYTILTVGAGLDVEFVPLAYDHEALAREMEVEQLPREFIETIRTGWWTTCCGVGSWGFLRRQRPSVAAYVAMTESTSEAPTAAGPRRALMLTTLREAYDDPQVRAREMVLVDGRGWRHIGLPLKYRNEPGQPSFDAPSLGGHSDEILRSLGYADAEIAAMRARGII